VRREAKEKKGILAVFQEFDADGNGTIEKDEVSKYEKEWNTVDKSASLDKVDLTGKMVPFHISFNNEGRNKEPLCICL
jgi:hypothetical protein